MRTFLALTLLTMPALLPAQQPDPYLSLMRAAAAHARAHGAPTPVLSPLDATVLSGAVPIAALAAEGILTVPWTTNDPEKMRAILALRPAGLISDYPNRLHAVILETPGLPPGFDLQGHRGARGLRPENTLPAFEAGLDNGIRTIETDTGVTSDHQSLISHDQFLNPQSCRRADGSPYTLQNRIYIRDLTLGEAQAQFICDRIHTGTPFEHTQQNALALSPVATAFAAEPSEHLPSPYSPTYAGQLFRFVSFYATYYTTGPGRTSPDAPRRALTAQNVRFNLETKIIPDNLPESLLKQLSPGTPTELLANHTFSPQLFVDTLCAAIESGRMQSRATVQSFDFRTLQLVEEQHPTIQTVYLTGLPQTLSTELLPQSLRQ